MGWLWRADADGGTGGEETPRRRELPDDTASDMEQWGGSNAAPPKGIVTGNSEFEANRFDMVRPITQERLGLLFDSEGWSWRIDSDGDLCGFWEGHLFCFRFLGDSREVLSIVAFMKNLVPIEYGEDLRDFLQAWHGEFLWPKAYIADQDEGDRVVAEVNADYEYGATDAQLVQQVMCALATTLQLFRALEERYGLDDDEGPGPAGGHQRGFDGPTWLPEN